MVAEKENGLDYLRVLDPKTKASHRIATDEPDYAIFLAQNPEFNTTVVRFNYQSMVTPPSRTIGPGILAPNRSDTPSSG